MRSLSVVIPAYNEESVIEDTLTKIFAYLRGRFTFFEVIVVTDGSQDQTAAICQTLAAQLPELTILQNTKNFGKGYAVKRGFSIAKGDFILLFDADSSTPIEDIEKMVPYCDDGFDIVVGSRALPESNVVKRQMPHRQAMGRIFNACVQLLVLRGIKDTQCGFKLFRRTLAERLAARQTCRRFCFDVELLFIAKKWGHSIKEVPVTWCNREASKVNIIFGSSEMFTFLFVILWKNFLGHYNETA